MGNITYTHADRDAVIARADLGEIAELHGFRRGRWKMWHCAFHGEDRNASASLRGRRLHCFTCNRSWDIFALVAEAQGVGFQEALRWLADYYHVPLNHEVTDRERFEYARRRARAQAEAHAMLLWEYCCVDTLRELRDVYLHAYHRGLRYINRNGLDAQASSLAADVIDLYEPRCENLDRGIERVEQTPSSVVLPHFRNRRKSA
jgi:hypothetical protein